LKGLQLPIVYTGQDCSVGASIGISLYPDHANNIEDLIKNADKAMYAVKEAGRNTYRIFNPEIQSS